MMDSTVVLCLLDVVVCILYHNMNKAFEAVMWCIELLATRRKDHHLQHSFFFVSTTT
jgi:hypothetical protein